MSRPNKQGIDYFTFDVYLDDKFELIEATHNLEGFAIVVKLLQKIYSYGYYYNWGRKEKLLFKKKVNVSINLIDSIIEDCFEFEIFNRKLFKKHEILTSSGIQKRYFHAIRRRKSIEVIEEYLLVNVNIIQDNVNINLRKLDNNKHSIVKDSIVKDTKEKYMDHVFLFSEEYQKLLDRFGKKEALEKIESLNNYLGSKGKKYKSHYYTILTWARKEEKEGSGSFKAKGVPRPGMKFQKGDKKK